MIIWETLYETVVRIQDNRPVLYDITIYRYDYATGKVTACNYHRNPFDPDRARREFTARERLDFFCDGFWPSLTKQLTGYV